MSEGTDRAKTKPPSVDRLSQLWRRINDYKIAQWSVAYVALAYGIQHGIILTSESLEWPNTVARVSMLLLALGLPLVMTFAWYHGERASRHFSKAEVTIVSILLVIGSMFFYVFVQPSAEVATASRSNTQQAGVAAARRASLSPAGAISLAVLPFTNLSSDAEQEFFSDGMTEEVTAALAKIPDLRVVARTSAFQFKGQNQDMHLIGEALRATHLIEGSVRKAGTRVRITAQLIRTDDGTHIWSENYDRELTDVFAIQEEIATAIAGALRMPLGLKPGERLVSNRAIDPESYQQYLHARAVFRARSGPPEIENLEQVVARDPGYAPAWVLLARLDVGQNPDRAEKAIREALRLDPRNAIAYTVLANIQDRLGNYAAAKDLQNQALTLDPDDPDVLDSFSNGLALRGQLTEAVRMREKLRALEPFVPVYNYITASILLNNGQSQTAIAILKAMPAGPAGGPEGARGVTLARAYAAEGRYGEAADTLLAIPQTGEQGQQNRASIEEAARLLRNAPTKVSMPNALPAWDGELSFVYVYVGAPDRVLDQLERLAAARGLNPPAARYLWASELAPIRKTERFKAFVRKIGAVERWRAQGWPDHCHPVGADNFACE